ncbi:hypothetical protein O3G_MSEX004203 [Manduca sexta]|uniref:Uncharacterized protein n=1 Tax=Manduca sexta TaxID=7130 RepID=A0A921YUR2_MANSE|nr:hypothetical protein O3G_MSEX004203 [Manduca sexta]
MPAQPSIMPLFDLKVYVRVVAAFFAISSATALVMSLLRLVNPELYYLEPLDGSKVVIHFIFSGLMVLASCIGFLNSCVVMNRSSSNNTGRYITSWLLLDSLFEITRVIYVFVGEVVLKGDGPLQIYELVISAVQYC